jgi:hypothetical protein
MRRVFGGYLPSGKPCWEILSLVIGGEIGALGFVRRERNRPRTVSALAGAQARTPRGLVNAQKRCSLLDGQGTTPLDPTQNFSTAL